jgi:hypothetical protein
MKTNTVLNSAIIGLATLLNASAAVNTVYITGSTAFRSQTFLGIKATFDGGNPQLAARGGSALDGNNANFMLFHGNVGGVETFVDCVWSGSEAGVASVAQPGSHPTYYLKTDGTVAYTITSSNPTSTETNSTPSTSDLAFTDSSQSVSLTPTPALVPQGAASPAGAVGVVPFTWAKNKNSTPSAAWNRLVNITDAQARNALAGPNVAAAFTGNSADISQYVYCVGRNNGSGTRVNCLAACRYGITKPVDQFFIGGNPSDAATLVLTEADAGGNGGYESGGSVAKALGIDGSCQQTDPNFGNSGWIAIAYLGIGDAKNIGGSGLGQPFWLTLNGVAESNGAIEEGQYNYWNYERLYGRVGISGFAATYGSSLAAAVPTQLGGANPAANDGSIQLGFMHASKPSDIGDPFHN